MPLVSVIIPVYQRLNFLSGAIESVLNQSLSNIEILVADDGSDTDVGSLVESFIKRGVRYRRNPVNVGVVANLKSAIEQTSAEYIAILNDDDLWEPSFLERMLEPIRSEPTVALSFCDHWIINAAGEIDEEASCRNTRQWKRHLLREGAQHPFIKETLVFGSIPAVMGTVFRRSAVAWSEIPAEVGGYYDYWIAYQAVRRGSAAWYTNRRLVHYRVHDQSETARLSTRARNMAARQAFFILGEMLKDESVAIAHRDLAKRALRRLPRVLWSELTNGRVKPLVKATRVATKAIAALL